GRSKTASAPSADQVGYISTAIRYIFVLPTDEPDQASAFQGFSTGLFNIGWALRGLMLLPSNLLEAALPYDAALARRIGGIGGWTWAPLSVRSLVQIDIDAEDPFWVVLTHDENETATVTKWADQHTLRPLVVAPEVRTGAVLWDRVNAEMIRQHVE